MAIFDKDIQLPVIGASDAFKITDKTKKKWRSSKGYEIALQCLYEIKIDDFNDKSAHAYSAKWLCCEKYQELCEEVGFDPHKYYPVHTNKYKGAIIFTFKGPETGNGLECEEYIFKVERV